MVSGSGKVRVRGAVSIRWRLAGATLVTVGAVLALGFGLVAVRGEQALLDDVTADTVLTGRLLAEHSAGDLAFGARDESKRLLSNLSVDPRVECAALYDGEGKLFSSYCATGAQPPTSTIDPPRPPEEVRADEDRIVTIAPVSHKGDRFGTVIVATSTSEAVARANALRLAIVGLGTVLALAGVGIASALNRAVFGRLVRLAETAEGISARHDWAVRAKVGGGREVEMLARGINTMLEAVQEEEARRDEAERDQRRYLERLRALRAIDRAILEARPPRAVADHVVKHLLAVTRCTRVGVVELTAAGPVVMARGGADVAAVDGDAFPCLGGAVPVHDVGRPHVVQLQIRALDETLGCLVVAAPPGARVADDDAAFAREVADLLAVSIRQARLASAIERHTEALERTVEERTRALSDTVRELERFAYSVAHDLRAPLRAVQGYASLVRTECAEGLTQPCREYLGRVVSASERMDRLIVDLLEYSRLGREPLKVLPVELDEVVADVLSMLGVLVRERGAQVTVEGPLPAVLGSRTALVQVVANLVDNATKFVRPGELPVVRVRAERREPNVRLIVEDNGIGIEPEHVGRIFGVFQRLHRTEVYPGTGIGLAIVKRAVERMGGTVGLLSTPGVGSQFWVELPAPPQGEA